MNTPRDLTKLLEAILKEVPVEEYEFRMRLEYIKKKIMYTAPEIMHHCWNEAEIAINNYLPEPAKLNEWQTNVVNLWIGKTAI